MTGSSRWNRREMLTLSGMAAGSLVAMGWNGNRIAGAAAPAERAQNKAGFRYCLNMGTVRGHNLTLEEEIDLAAAAGYDAVEPWVERIGAFAEKGGSLEDLAKKIADKGLTVESAIGFSPWIVDDDQARVKGLEQMKADMDKVARLGGKRIAAPPVGATNQPGLDLRAAAARYRELLLIGDSFGVVPEVELWGFSKNLNRIGDCMFVVLESGHPKACLLPDVFHIYKGGSDFSALSRISASAMPVFHINDYPAVPPRDQANDGDRIYPGDGVAPMNDILGYLMDGGGGNVLSLELFSKELYKQPAPKVAADGLAKMKAAVASAEAARG